MRTQIVCVGKIKEKFFRDAVLEYSKRLSRYVKLDIVEVSDERAPENISLASQKNIKDKEGERIIKAVKNSFVVALDLKGLKFSSEKFADFIKKSRVLGTGDFTFIIGGSLGLSDKVLEMADFRLCFSDMTFPHQLMRVILLEQIYRAEKIIANEPYHK